ncbi:SLC13 family permease [Desulfofundulus thermobenzoicus]|uniref:SLC13 family permease n=1 Tax=Desulfofundulus thermobenzoicus TaxID=29376 RepID=UPI001A9BF35E|nr:SLC13 family permease [Desulfofundulus thermobenzoicus]
MGTAIKTVSGVKTDKKKVRTFVGIILAIVVLIAFQSINFPSTLTPTGHALLSVLASMLVLWISEAVSYSASSFFLIAAFTVLVAFCPDPDKPANLIGTEKALGMALSGFSSSAWVLVCAALFISAAIEKSGLGERIGLVILNRMGARPKRVLVGVLLMSFILTLFIPAQAANAALMTAVSVGIIGGDH